MTMSNKEKFVLIANTKMRYAILSTIVFHCFLGLLASSENRIYASGLPEIEVSIDKYWLPLLDRAVLETFPSRKPPSWHDVYGGPIVFKGVMPIRCVIKFANQGSVDIDRKITSSNFVFRSKNVNACGWIKVLGSRCFDLSGKTHIFSGKDTPVFEVSYGEDIYKSARIDINLPVQIDLIPGKNVGKLFVKFDSRNDFWISGRWTVTFEVVVPNYPTKTLELKFRIKKLQSKEDQANHIYWVFRNSLSQKDYKSSSLDHLERIIEIYPIHAKLLKEKADLLIDMGNYGQSVNVYREILELHRNGKIKLRLLREETKEAVEQKLITTINMFEHYADLKLFLLNLTSLNKVSKERLLKIGKNLQGYSIPGEIKQLYCQQVSELEFSDSVPLLVNALEVHQGYYYDENGTKISLKNELWKSIRRLKDLNKNLFDPYSTKETQEKQIKKLKELL